MIEKIEWITCRVLFYTLSLSLSLSLSRSSCVSCRMKASQQKGEKLKEGERIEQLFAVDSNVINLIPWACVRRSNSSQVLMPVLCVSSFSFICVYVQSHFNNRLHCTLCHSVTFFALSLFLFSCKCVSLPCNACNHGDSWLAIALSEYQSSHCDFDADEETQLMAGIRFEGTTRGGNKVCTFPCHCFNATIWNESRKEEVETYDCKKREREREETFGPQGVRTVTSMTKRGWERPSAVHLTVDSLFKLHLPVHWECTLSTVCLHLCVYICMCAEWIFMPLFQLPLLSDEVM